MAGPWICIAGAVYLEKPVIAPLTDYISLMETYDTNHKHRIARLFQAFSNGINNLKAFYQQNIPAASSNLEFLYPFPCQYVDGQSTVRFSYIEPLKVDSVKHWKARNTEGKDIVIKFTQRYNEAAHKLCATKNMAPQLLYVGKEVYGWCMVVMEYIDGVTLSQANLTRDVYLEVLEKVEEAIKILHENNIVFGDLRPPNIMVQQNGGNPCVKLIDFDWAGRDQVDCYPPFMNHVHIKWPEGASDGKILQKKHDLVMLDYLKDNADQLNT
jgi:serine/threonine protein kinase